MDIWEGYGIGSRIKGSEVLDIEYMFELKGYSFFQVPDSNQDKFEYRGEPSPSSKVHSLHSQNSVYFKILNSKIANRKSQNRKNICWRAGSTMNVQG